MKNKNIFSYKYIGIIQTHYLPPLILSKIAKEDYYKGVKILLFVSKKSYFYINRQFFQSDHIKTIRVLSVSGLLRLLNIKISRNISELHLFLLKGHSLPLKATLFFLIFPLPRKKKKILFLTNEGFLETQINFLNLYRRIFLIRSICGIFIGIYLLVSICVQIFIKSLKNEV